MCNHIFSHNMANLTLAIPDELRKKMKKHSEVRWSEVIRKSLERKINDLDLLDKITNKSKLTKKGALEISEKINKSVIEKLGWLALAEKSMMKIWDNKKDDKIWSKYV